MQLSKSAEKIWRDRTSVLEPVRRAGGKHQSFSPTVAKIGRQRLRTCRQSVWEKSGGERESGFRGKGPGTIEGKLDGTTGTEGRSAARTRGKEFMLPTVNDRCVCVLLNFNLENG